MKIAARLAVPWFVALLTILAPRAQPGLTGDSEWVREVTPDNPAPVARTEASPSAPGPSARELPAMPAAVPAGSLGLARAFGVVFAYRFAEPTSTGRRAHGRASARGPPRPRA